jgi:hypothetical protein
MTGDKQKEYIITDDQIKTIGEITKSERIMEILRSRPVSIDALESEIQRLLKVCYDGQFMMANIHPVIGKSVRPDIPTFTYQEVYELLVNAIKDYDICNYKFIKRQEPHQRQQQE